METSSKLVVFVSCGGVEGRESLLGNVAVVMEFRRRRGGESGGSWVVDSAMLCCGGLVERETRGGTVEGELGIGPNTREKE